MENLRATVSATGIRAPMDGVLLLRGIFLAVEDVEREWFTGNAGRTIAADWQAA
jgi:hypothetical protein